MGLAWRAPGATLDPHEGPMTAQIDKAKVQQVAIVLGTYLLAFTGLDFVAAEFEVARGVSLWYPPAALGVMLLLLFGVRWAPALALAVVVHSSVVARVGLYWWQVAILALVTAASYGAAVWVMTRRLEVDPRLPTLRDVLWFGLMLCLLAPVPMSVVQVWLLDSAGSIDSREFISGAAGFWAGAATGVGMLAPIGLVVARRWTGDEQFEPDLGGARSTGSGRFEVVAQVVALAVAVWIAFANNGGSLDYSYLIYAPLIWIGLRGGFSRTAVAVLAANIGAVALNGGEIPADGGFALQFGLVSFTLLGVTLGAAVAQRKADGERNLRASLRDPLTTLANRTLLNDRLNQVLRRRPDQPAGEALPNNGALLLLDVDRFKQINDALGHGAGDTVLVEVGRRLVSAVREVDTVARLGGDEFAVLLDGIHPDEIDEAAQRVLDSVMEPIETKAGTVHLTTSVGSVLVAPAAKAPGDPSNVAVEQVLHHGDIALHRAKRGGRNRHVAFDAEMREQAVLLQSRETALREALGRHEIAVVFQPIVEVASGQVVGAEALARWTPHGGPAIPASELVAAAEGSSLISELGREVLRTSCTEAAAWPDPLRLAINVSAIELRQAGYAESVLSILEEVGFPSDRLELEITETQMIDEVETTTTTLTDAGVHLVLDDFGTGYSSISYLHDMPISAIKIDHSYVSTLDSDPRSIGMVKAILCIATELRLDVTAEGVESDQHWDFLVEHGCTRAQGFLFGRPRPGVPAID